MASRRKTFNPGPRVPPTERAAYAAFIRALLDGTVTATALVEVDQGQGQRKRLDYDEPNG